MGRNQYRRLRGKASEVRREHDVPKAKEEVFQNKGNAPVSNGAGDGSSWMRTEN